MNFRRILEVLCLQVLQKKFLAKFHELYIQKRSGLLWSSDAFWKFSACEFYSKSSGRNSTICASKNEAVCREIETHSGSSLPASFTEKVLGASPRFVRPRTKLFGVTFTRISKVLCLQGLQKKFWAIFHDIHVQKCSGLLWNSHAFVKLSLFKLYKKSSGRIFPIYASKNKAVCRGAQTHSGSSLPASFTEKVLGAILRFARPKTKLFAVKFRRILEVLCLRVLQKKFWGQFHHLFVEERSCLPWNSGSFRKYSACKVYRKSFGRNSTIYVSKNEAVCCEIQTHFGSSCLASFMNNVLGAFSLFMRLKTKLFGVKFRRILEVLCLRVLQKKLWTQFQDFCVQKQSCLLWSSDAFWNFSASKIYRKSFGGNSTICASKNEAVCREIKTHSWSSLPASFKEKVLGAIPWYFRPRTKLFPVKFRCNLKVLCLQVLRTSCGSNSTILC